MLTFHYVMRSHFAFVFITHRTSSGKVPMKFRSAELIPIVKSSVARQTTITQLPYEGFFFTKVEFSLCCESKLQVLLFTYHANLLMRNFSKLSTSSSCRRSSQCSVYTGVSKKVDLLELSLVSFLFPSRYLNRRLRYLSVSYQKTKDSPQSTSFLAAILNTQLSDDLFRARRSRLLRKTSVKSNMASNTLIMARTSSRVCYYLLS